MLAFSDTESQAAERRSRSVLLLLCAQVFLIHVGQQLVIPILPLYAAAFGIGSMAIGTMLTLQSVPRLFVSVPAGHVADRFGAHRVLLAAFVLAVGSAVIGAIASDYATLLTSRVVQGVASGMSATAGLTYAASLGGAGGSGRQISLYQGAHLLGNSFGPLAGGLIAQAFGYRAPFVVYGVIAAGTALWLWRRLPDPRQVPGAATTPADTHEGLRRPAPRDLARLLLSAGVLLSCVIGLVAAFTRSGTRNFGLVMLADLRGVGEGRIGLMLSAIFLANVAVLYLVGLLVDRFGARVVFVPGWLVMAFGLYLVTRPGAYAMLLAGAVIYGIGSGIGNSVPAMHIASIVAPHQRGLALGMYRTFGDLGLILGPLVMGVLIVSVGVANGILFTAALVAVTAVVFWFLGPARKADA